MQGGGSWGFEGEFVWVGGQRFEEEAGQEGFAGGDGGGEASGRKGAGGVRAGQMLGRDKSCCFQSVEKVQDYV